MQVLSLHRTASGWALVDERRRVVFEARGRDGRRQCLAYAAQLGVMRVRFDEQLDIGRHPRGRERRLHLADVAAGLRARIRGFGSLNP
jgi:hypothetical protein